MKRKHFVIPGAQRCGSTYLYGLLDSHPEILKARPAEPEPKYFLPRPGGTHSLEAYLKEFFPGNEPYAILGEKSVSYFEIPEAAQSIRRVLPETKILVILRDPIERAVSNYWFTRAHGLEDRSLEEVFGALEDRVPGPESRHISVSPFRYLGRGLYGSFLDLYAGIFGHQNLKIVILEDLIRRPDAIKDIYVFVGARPDFLPSRNPSDIHESEKGEERLSPAARLRLAAFFKKSNEKIAREYGLNLEAWSSWDAHA